jgi:hypothetical protein
MNRKYKDSVFIKLFSNVHNLRELYNALAGTNYKEDTEIVINTLKDTLFQEQLNDISFIIEDKLVVLIEHQSTMNQNMPLRSFIFGARLYENWLGKMDKAAIHRSKRIIIPNMEFFMIYNGQAEQPDYQELKLSDGFVNRDKPINPEVIVKAYNINHGRNTELLNQSQTLREYAVFVAKVRELMGKNPAGKNKSEKKKVLQEAVKWCIDQDILKAFIEEHGTEVTNMLMAEWNWDDYVMVKQEEAVEDALEEVREQLAVQGEQIRQDQEQLAAREERIRQDQEQLAAREERIRQLEEENRRLRNKTV